MEFLGCISFFLFFRVHWCVSGWVLKPSPFLVATHIPDLHEGVIANSSTCGTRMKFLKS